MKIISLILSGVLLFSQTPSLVFAAGMTSHSSAAAMVIGQLDEDLASIINQRKQTYYNGVFWPDAVLEKLQEGGKNYSDGISHGQKASVSSPKGWTFAYLNEYKTRCDSSNPAKMSNDCKDALAFFVGAVAHLIVDGPWHSEFIAHASKDKCADKTLEGNGIDEGRHGIADSNVDFCLERKFRDHDSDIHSETFKPARYSMKQGCDGGSFDGLDGKCYKCPSPSYQHRAIYNAKDARACYQSAAYE